MAYNRSPGFVMPTFFVSSNLNKRFKLAEWKAMTRLNPTYISYPLCTSYQTKRRNNKKKLSELTANDKNLLLVDFGCGDMPYRSVIEPKVGKYLGVDLEMNPKAEHHIGFDSKTTLPDNYADIILSNQVLEHVDSPGGYLQEGFYAY